MAGRLRRSNRRWWLRALGPLTVPAVLLLATPLISPSSIVSAGAADSASTTPTWSALSPPVSPPGLHDASAAYDPDNKTVIVFGGVTADGTLSDATWVFDGTTWSQVGDQLSVPAPREDASLAYDPNLDQLVLFGGNGPGGTLLGDTWAWNGAQWVALDTAADPQSLPSPRAGASLAVDATGRLVLFGGSGDAGSPGAPDPVVLGDTWGWDGTAWTQLQPVNAPLPRSAASLTWDSVLGSTVLFGGSSSPLGAPATPLNDTWMWNGTTWTAVSPLASPPPRSAAISASAGDISGDIVSTGTSTNGVVDDTWGFDGTTWTALPAVGLPVARTAAASAWDAATAQLVIFGGISGDGAILGDTEVLSDVAPVVTTTTTLAPSTPTTVGNNGGGSDGGSSGHSGTGGHSGPGAATGQNSGPGATGHTFPSPTTPGAGRTGVSTPPSGKSKTTTTVATSHSSVVPPGVATTLPGHHVDIPSAPRAGVPAAAPLAAGSQTVHVGSLVTLLGSGFKPGALVVITFHSTPFTVGRVFADAEGSFSATVTVPSEAVPGRHHLVASGAGPRGTPRILTTPIRVVAYSTALPGKGPGTTIVMVLIAFLVPAVTWSIFAIRGRRRPQPVPG